ncbi:hypothetical protein COT30_03740 [Candidatus Micrarchaeota archaeon CG08_land_8_20_14_0_20_49_17]|nr:MAG: hypothetical protein AUJ13_05305 [Candidatus Micrarchaeota archaeon CG1_02_49_24]PIU09569.1 MAG: hypothetical protein COT30_03740 [Candidatus Micrarchaeota archaeon CG08_land_8_20_14_0_20_49_17]PIU81419.1 MAG: hypothetical protein COS70_04205 [Candidatus Micrarchaeota archaeon CG06_land_8_20_14_3_00_50_6]PIZ92188.1 MAG: hypothetical protein COX84_07250 [Candidatus Micrarchaeota archaeon CG_4_10_14_0_2_um_filter_49_7]HII54431.1 polyprenyl synthetase family protein [Candidatus Micrarchaeo
MANVASKIDVKSLLAAHAEKTNAFMNALIPSKEPLEVYGVIKDFLSRGGKRFRPALCMLAASAVGGKESEVMPAAASIELFHSFTLLHDDIMDNSKLRRGLPCVHIIEGIPIAINAGDGMFMMVWASLFRLKPDRGIILKAQEMLLSKFTKVLEGQAVELSWIRGGSWDISESDYFEMACGKTAALIAAACEVGAFLAGGSKSEVAALSEYGRLAGIGFQIRDDILNLVGEEDKYKKEIGGDITEGKRTLMTIHSMAHCSPSQKQRLIYLLSSNTMKPLEIKEAIAIMKSTGSIAYADKIALTFIENAKRQLKKLKPTSSRQALEAISDFLAKRDR